MTFKRLVRGEVSTIKEEDIEVFVLCFNVCLDVGNSYNMNVFCDNYPTNKIDGSKSFILFSLVIFRATVFEMNLRLTLCLL